MAKYFVTQHAGALEWARAEGIEFEHVSHLDTSIVNCGDHVIGTLPTHLAAEIIAKGARYFHLEMTVPEDRRLARRDYSAKEMQDFEAKLVEYRVTRVEGDK